MSDVRVRSFESSMVKFVHLLQDASNGMAGPLPPSIFVQED